MEKELPPAESKLTTESEREDWSSASAESNIAQYAITSCALACRIEPAVREIIAVSLPTHRPWAFYTYNSITDANSTFQDANQSALRAFRCGQAEHSAKHASQRQRTSVHEAGASRAGKIFAVFKQRLGI
jgi:hypothetical protein